MGDNKEEREENEKDKVRSSLYFIFTIDFSGMQPTRDSGRLSRNRNKYPFGLGRSNRPSAGRSPVIFYPKDTQGRKIDTYLPAKGGEMKVPRGITWQ